MVYCRKCETFFGGEHFRCPVCGTQLKMPDANELVLLVADSPLHLSLVEPLLEDHEIPFYNKLKQNPQSKAQLYVPFGAYDQAKQLLERASK